MIIGNKYHGFKLKEIKEMIDINSTTYYFIHEKTNGELFYISNKDENKTFSISFKTPPEDETGLTHILEHCVLSGSKKYPVKSPFLELRKSSLSTFLNAMTFSDKTMYPVSSINDKDFRNLTDTYLDAVFNPLVLEKKEIFLQEGWRYETNQETGELLYNGIVFNEMKGAYSSPDRILINLIKSSLYPENAYGLDSGGNPDRIPELQYSNFVNYHKKYYHPSNAYIFLYGKLDIMEYLEYLDKEYLGNYDDNQEKREIPFQKNTGEVKEKNGFYGISKDQSTKNKTYLSKSYVTGKITEKSEVLAIMVLEKVLFDPSGSELKKRLMNADIAEEIDGFFYTLGLQPFFTFLARNSEIEHYEIFDNIIKEYLEELINKGIPEDLLIGSLNSIEFRLRENALSSNRGINYAQSVMNSWLYGENPAMYLEFSEDIAFLRENLNTGYFENYLKKFFIDNTHSTKVLLMPDSGLEEKNNKENMEKLVKVKENMSTFDFNTISEENNALERYQKDEDSEENLGKLPTLDISDIKKEHEIIPLKEMKDNGITYLLHPMFTNKITYLDLYFDTDTIPVEKIKYIFLLNDLLTSLSTKNYDYQKLSSLINIYTGGIDFSVSCINRIKSKDIRPIIRAGTKTFPENLDKTMEILREILIDTIFTDKKKLKEEITELKAMKENDFLDDSMGIAQIRLASYFTASGKYQEEGNIEYFYFLKDLFDNFEDKYQELSIELTNVAESIFDKNQLTVSITRDSEDIMETQKEVAKHIDKLPSINRDRIKYDFKIENLQEGIAIPAKVQYVVKGGNFINSGHKYSGNLKVAAKILNTNYLWQELRVLGGAYGGFASISIFGNIIFSSYRDPKLKETLDVYRKASSYFKELSLDKKELTRYIIGTIGDLDSPMNVSVRGRISNLYYFQEFKNEDLQKIRDEILEVTLGDLVNFGKVLEDINNEDIHCVIGNEEKLNENKKLFKKILKIN